MQPWERRLKDLAQLLRNCEATYFDPDLFRMNTNQFLQTARTVTFLIQKNKWTIADYQTWYDKNVIAAWASDDLMKWAKDSRNKIEKEGDLDLHSSLTVTLLFSYREETDISLACSRTELVGANVRKLLRFARQRLPSGVSDDSAIRLERRWVANSLPAWELLQAFRYIFSRLRVCCADLARHLGLTLDESIPVGTDFDEVNTDARAIRYVQLNDLQLRSLTAIRLSHDPDFVPPPPLQEAVEEFGKGPRPSSLAENLAFCSRIAEATFEHHGNHQPMLFLFDEKWHLIDMVGVEFSDQVSKYIFWRSVADRVAYLAASSIVWVAEAWLRDASSGLATPAKAMPIVGETLHMVAMNRSGEALATRWAIRRPSPKARPHLERLREDEDEWKVEGMSFLAPIRKAFGLPPLPLE